MNMNMNMKSNHKISAASQFTLILPCDNIVSLSVYRSLTILCFAECIFFSDVTNSTFQSAIFVDQTPWIWRCPHAAIVSVLCGQGSCHCPSPPRDRPRMVWDIGPQITATVHTQTSRVHDCT